MFIYLKYLFVKPSFSKKKKTLISNFSTKSIIISTDEMVQSKFVGKILGQKHFIFRIILIYKDFQ